MSIHSTQEQATVYPVVVLWKVEDRVREDHFVFISDDLKHDIPFVEICNSMIHKHYTDRNIPLTRDIEFGPPGQELKGSLKIFSFGINQYL